MYNFSSPFKLLSLCDMIADSPLLSQPYPSLVTRPGYNASHIPDTKFLGVPCGLVGKK